MLRDPKARLVRIHSKLTVVLSGRPGPTHPFNCSQLGPPKANIPCAPAISLRSGDDDAHPSKIQIPTKQSKAKWRMSTMPSPSSPLASSPTPPPPSGTGTTSSACSRPRSPLAPTSPLCYKRAPPPASGPRQGGIRLRRRAGSSPPPCQDPRPRRLLPPGLRPRRRCPGQELLLGF